MIPYKSKISRFLKCEFFNSRNQFFSVILKRQRLEISTERETSLICLSSLVLYVYPVYIYGKEVFKISQFKILLLLVICEIQFLRNPLNFSIRKIKFSRNQKIAIPFAKFTKFYSDKVAW